MWEKSVKKIKNNLIYLYKDKENLCFTIWLLWMAVYYGARMFVLTPWYDELYTYYYFISRGPVYAAIHWPLPNNHVGYSVLSGFFDLMGNSIIGLRGVSYICALANLVLLYRIGRKSLVKGCALAGVLLYSCMNLVNQLAVQGRGYTLAVTCCLTAVRMLQKIGLNEEREDKRHIKYYVIFSLALTLGLYVLPSSVYWVIPVCITGGLFLLVYKKIKPLVHLIISSIAAAFNTVVLYCIIWLAIGSNLLSKTEGSGYFGQGHISIITQAPFAAIKTGMDYMLATPYIQSVERSGYLSKLGGWLRTFSDYYYPHAGLLLIMIIIIGIIYVAIQVIRQYREKAKEKVFVYLYAMVLILLMPVFLTIQCKLPYFRVFSYIGIPVALLLACLLEQVTEIARRSMGMLSHVIPIGAIALFAIVLLLSGDYNREYGMSEYYARDALSKTEIGNDRRLCVTDCYQQYLLKFYWDIECENIQIEDADMVILHQDMTDKDYDEFRWEFYHTYASIPWDYVNNTMVPVYENEEYIVYEKK